MTHPLQATIEELWERRTELSPQSAPTTIAAIESVIGDLDSGKLRVAEKIGGEWFTHQWIKKAVLLSFRVRDNRVQQSGDVRFFDKVDTKFEGWTEEQFRQGGFRVVPGTIARKGSFVAKNAVLMPSFVNIGAYVDEGTMVDTWVTVTSSSTPSAPSTNPAIRRPRRSIEPAVTRMVWAASSESPDRCATAPTSTESIAMTTRLASVPASATVVGGVIPCAR